MLAATRLRFCGALLHRCWRFACGGAGVPGMSCLALAGPMSGLPLSLPVLVCVRMRVCLRLCVCVCVCARARARARDVLRGSLLVAYSEQQPPDRMPR